MRPLLLLAVLAAAPVAAQASFSTFRAFTNRLDTLGAMTDPAAQAAAVEALWSDLRAAQRIPFALGDSVAFLWRGTASRVHVNGDFNRWGGVAATVSPNQLQRVGTTDVWRLVRTFPATARLDYKLVLNGTSWILDPHNPHQQWGGFGPNSELRMPAWIYPAETVRRAGVPQGTLGPNVRRRSARLGYDVQYRVYTPAGYDTLAALPTLYVTDGHEYADDRLGSLVIALDNLIADGRIAPLVAVMVDPRNPDNLSQNRRAEQYVENPAFVAFLADELAPAVDAAYRTRPEATARAILGTSLGGVCAAYVGATRPAVFGLVAMQSPALWSAATLAGAYAATPRLPVRLALTTGTVYDGEADTRAFRQTLVAGGYPHVYAEVPESHSWGNWRQHYDTMLGFLFPPEPSVAAEPPLPTAALALTVFPNPFRDAATLTFTLPRPLTVGVAVWDVLGRRVQTLAPPTPRPAGVHTLPWQGGGLAPGLYLVRLTGDATATQGVVKGR